MPLLPTIARRVPQLRLEEKIAFCGKEYSVGADYVLWLE